MGPVGLPSRDTRTVPCLAGGLSGVGSSVLPRDGTSRAVAANETAYRLSLNPLFRLALSSFVPASLSHESVMT